jgi:hypothetical protein
MLEVIKNVTKSPSIGHIKKVFIHIGGIHFV